MCQALTPRYPAASRFATLSARNWYLCFLFFMYMLVLHGNFLGHCYKAYFRGCRTPTCWQWRPPRALTPTSTQDQPSASCSTDTLSRTWYGARQSRCKHFDIFVSVPAFLLVCHTKVVGGPAYNTGQLQRGDEILLVDGVESQTVSVLWAIFTRAGMCLCLFLC